MSDMLSQLVTPELKFVFFVFIAFIVLLYVLSIVWTVRDAYLRGTNPLLWGIVAIVPFVGCLVYAMMRPPLFASDREEQNIGLLLSQRELMAYGECPKCGYPTERDFVLCPNCHVRLKNQCPSCMRTLEPEWSVCPYCATPITRARRAGEGAPVEDDASTSVSRASARRRTRTQESLD